LHPTIHVWIHWRTGITNIISTATIPIHALVGIIRTIRIVFRGRWGYSIGAVVHGVVGIVGIII
jgi:tetrahydromethanopterin S-methyltransferase subunit H